MGWYEYAGDRGAQVDRSGSAGGTSDGGGVISHADQRWGPHGSGGSASPELARTWWRFLWGLGPCGGIILPASLVQPRGRVGDELAVSALPLVRLFLLPDGDQYALREVG